MNDEITPETHPKLNAPAALVEAEPDRPLDLTDWRVLAYILWRGHVSNWRAWGEAEDGGVRAFGVHYPLTDIRRAVGLKSARTNAGVIASLRKLGQTRFMLADGQAVRLVELLELKHGNQWVIYKHTKELVALNIFRHAYARLDIVQMRALRRPLDHILYMRTCLVRARRAPFFTLDIPRCAASVGLGAPGWAAFRRPLIASLGRLAALLDLRFYVLVQCSGQLAGGDVVRVVVREAGAEPGPLDLRGAQVVARLRVDAAGVETLSGPGARRPSTRAA